MGARGGDLVRARASGRSAEVIEGVLHLRFVPLLGYVQVWVGRSQADPATVEVLERAVVDPDLLDRECGLSQDAGWRAVHDLDAAIAEGLVPAERDRQGGSWADMLGKLRELTAPLLDARWTAADEVHQEESWEYGDSVAIDFVRGDEAIEVELYETGEVDVFNAHPTPESEADDEPVGPLFVVQDGDGELLRRFRAHGWLRPDRDPRASSYITEVFELLARDKELPKNQFERRVDPLLAPFLPEILSKWFGGEVVSVVSEFPLKKEGNFQSTNVDHLYARRGADGDIDRWIFVELKTDLYSLDNDQIVTYLHAIDYGMPALQADIEQIAARTAAHSRPKYAALLDRLEKFRSCLERPIELLLLCIVEPSATAHLLAVDRFRVHTFSELKEVELEEHSAAWTLFKELVLPVLM